MTAEWNVWWIVVLWGLKVKFYVVDATMFIISFTAQASSIKENFLECFLQYHSFSLPCDRPNWRSLQLVNGVILSLHPSRALLALISGETGEHLRFQGPLVSTAPAAIDCNQPCPIIPTLAWRPITTHRKFATQGLFPARNLQFRFFSSPTLNFLPGVSPSRISIGSSSRCMKQAQCRGRGPVWLTPAAPRYLGTSWERNEEEGTREPAGT